MTRLAKTCLRTRFIKLLLSLFFFSFMTATHAQTVSGKVADENRNNVAGVSVTVKGSAVGTTTDPHGQYTIKAGPNGTLVFSNVGYASQEVPVNRRKQVNVTLTSSAENLATVVVTALALQNNQEGW